MSRKPARSRVAHEPEVAGGDAGTEARILDSAEKLFAEFGFEGTSVRDINADASVNSGAIHYHFGSKEDLFRKVVHRRASILAQDRLDRLEACRAGEGRPQLLNQIIEAYVAPYFNPKLGSQEERLRFAKLRARLMAEYGQNDPSPLGKIHEDVGQRFVDTLAGALPHLSHREVRVRYLIMWSALNTLSAGHSRAALGGTRIGKEEHPLAEFEVLVPELIALFAALFSAPSTEAVAASAASRRRK
jgi:AcrR family transcriptional regulator